MASFGTVLTRVLDELDRNDITAQAKLAINSAIKFYGKHDWWFQESQDVFVTVSGQSDYTLTADYGNIITLRIRVNANDYQLVRRSWKQLDQWFISQSEFKSRPTDFAILNETLQMFPIPDAAYTATMSYVKKLNTDLSASADTSPFLTDEPEELIRTRAEKDLCARILQDRQRAEGYHLLEQELFESLWCRNADHIIDGESRPYGNWRNLTGSF